MKQKETRSSRHNLNPNNTVKPVAKSNSLKKTKKVISQKKTKKVVSLNPNKKKVIKKTVKPVKKRKIKYGRIFLALIVGALVLYLLWSIIGTSLTNIYIAGNKILSDQEIIEIAKLENYPSTFTNLSFQIEDRLEKSDYINTAKVKKKWFLKVYIEVDENRPLFYNNPKNKTVLVDKKEVSKKFNTPILINIIPNTIYDEFITKMGLLNEDTLLKISEIEYKPKEADNKRFLFKMTDGNYVYINYSKFLNINNYVDIIKYLGDKKGILNLDAGNSFEILVK